MAFLRTGNWSRVAKYRAADYSRLKAVHLALVGLVIVAHEMQDSVHEQLANFLLTAPGRAAGARPGNPRRNDNLSQERDAVDGLTRVVETQDIGRIVPAAISVVYRLHCLRAHESYR